MVVVLSDVDLVREVTLRQFSAFTNRGLVARPPASAEGFFPSLVKFVSNLALFGARDKYWKGIRGTANGVFHHADRIAAFCPAMQETARALVERLADLDGKECDLTREVGAMTLDVVGAAVFGVNFGALKSNFTSDLARAVELFFANRQASHKHAPARPLSLPLLPLLPSTASSRPRPPPSRRSPTDVLGVSLAACPAFSFFAPPPSLLSSTAA